MNLQHVRELRKNATDCERLLWLHLRAGRLQGFKFKRQQPLGNYIVDFVCFQTRLIVEADGGQHADQTEYDARRDNWLKSQGFTVLRFWNNDILTNTEGVLAVILDACSQYVEAPSPQPLSREGRGAKGAGYIQDHGADMAWADLTPDVNNAGSNKHPINTESPNSPLPALDDCMDAGGSAASGTVAERALEELRSVDHSHDTPLPARERGRDAAVLVVCSSPASPRAGEGPGERGRRLMSFPRYPNYKDSGVEWLGEVPEHWTVTSLKRGFDVRLGKMLQTESSSPDDELLPYLRAANIHWSGIDVSDVKMMWFSQKERVQLTLLPDDLLISEGGDVGRSAMWNSEIDNCHFQNSVNRVRALEGNSNRYIYYWVSVVKDKGYIDVLCNKSTIAHFTVEKVQAVPVPYPSLSEQKTIAAFLDRETAKIDALIAEQQWLIELLKEKRQAVISHAVTKGLNPDAPMKDSGIEWLGEVPAHWEVITAKRVAGVFVPQRNKPDLNDEGVGVHWATMEDMKAAEIHQTSLWVSAQAAKSAGSRVLKKGAVIASCVGNFGVASINAVDLIINQQLQAYIPQQNLKAEFFRYFLGVAKVYFEQVGTAATLTYVNQQGFENLPLALPSLIEQGNIVSYLDDEATKFDTLTTEAQHAITLLKERSTALISAAVTGKIDVRACR